jgi:8-oxo-dGTP pyrophosphatase MutT (NUDIX family)
MLRAWHHWDFPKGIREGDEEPITAAVRELREAVTRVCSASIPAIRRRSPLRSTSTTVSLHSHWSSETGNSV